MGKEVFSARVEAETRSQAEALARRWRCGVAEAVEGAVRMAVAPCDRAAAALLGLDGLDQGLRLQQHLEGWALGLEVAGADIADRFSPREWVAIADACNGTIMLSLGSLPGNLLAANVADAIRLDNLAYRHGLGKDEASGLPRRLSELGYLEAWAVIVAIEWVFAQDNLPAEAPWWRPDYRREWQRGKTAPASTE